MGCCGGEREKGPTNQTQRWDFITLSDFKATSAWTSVAYIWLWFMAFVAVAVYALDTFTAVNLLAFNKWSSSVQPKLAFKYSKWIFAACILLSWTLALYEWTRAIRTIRRGGVAQSFLDPLAANLQSMRPKGWRRFLVFTELTKSKKGADYVALFVYFSFKGAVRVILAEGPRQVINGLTLYAVMDADLVVHGQATSNNSSFVQFFLNIGALANDNLQQTLVYFSMLFTLVIWVFSALSLAVAAILYITFLWHYIPQRDGRLRTYCKRKVDRRLEKIVEHKIKAAVEEEERQRQKAENKADLQRQKTGNLLPVPGKLARQPTLPQFDSPVLQDEKMPETDLTRQDTTSSASTLPPYTRNVSQPQLNKQPALPVIDTGRPSMPGRANTSTSGWSNAASYASDAPLLTNTGFAGEDGIPTMPPAAYRQNSNDSFRRPLPERSMTQSTTQSSRPFTPDPTVSSRPPPSGPYGQPMRSNTGFSYDTEPRSAVSAISPQDAYGLPIGGPLRRPTPDSFGSAPLSQGPYSSRPVQTPIPQTPYSTLQSQQSFHQPGQQRQPPQNASFNAYVPGAISRTASPNSYEMTTQPSYTTNKAVPSQIPASAGAYKAFNPSAMTPSAQPALSEPQRNVTVAGQPGAAGNYFGHVNDTPQRSVTAPPENRLTTSYDDLLDSYGSSSRNSLEEPTDHHSFSSTPFHPPGATRAATSSPTLSLRPPTPQQQPQRR